VEWLLLLVVELVLDSVLVVTVAVVLVQLVLEAVFDVVEGQARPCVSQHHRFFRSDQPNSHDP